jgi:polyphosphate kinase
LPLRHIASGNYNPLTSRVYTDVGLLTADEEIGADVTSLFNFLTGYSQQSKYHRLLVAPLNLRKRLTELVRREKRNKLEGRDARIIVKVNSLTDTELIEELYSASQAGVEIDLIVRGICSLRPGVKGLSSNIRVRSVVGRFLEHSRVLYFANGGEPDDEEIYIGSADWMQRNLDRRVEIVVPILDPLLKTFLKDVYLDAYLRDNVNARSLRPDGSYRKFPSGEPFDAQMFFVGRDIE